MQTQVAERTTDTARYAKAITNSKRIRWDIDRDVIRDRSFDFSKRFLSEVAELHQVFLFVLN